MYSVRDACAVLGISMGRLRSYLRGGLLVPKRDETGKIQLSFQDLVVLRKAEGLVALRIPPRRVRTALRAVAERDFGAAGTGQAGLARLARLDLGSEGDTVVVRDGNKRWDALSGQALLAFGTSQTGTPEASIIPLTSDKSTPPRSHPYRRCLSYTNRRWHSKPRHRSKHAPSTPPYSNASPIAWMRTSIWVAC